MATESRGDAPTSTVDAQPRPAAAASPSAEQPPPQQQTRQDDDDDDDDDDDAPASPPLPPRHTPVTPGPRAARLQQLYGEALHHALGKVAAWDHFAGCFPTVAARAEGVLRQVQAQMVEKLGEKCEKEFENILVARQVVPKLNELEGLIADAADRRAASADDAPEPTPPHLLPPSRLLAAHLAPALAPHRSLLNARLQTTQAQNALLVDAVRAQREDIAALLDRLETAVDDVRGANRALGRVAADLAEEARGAAV
ncbi:Kinetochore-associated protein NNF1 [Tolypocladium ophioglossoides CBS 100239]|uniref:Kinetochore-associated protein NNF1 n=1 Tax=Tolypocladium ophioglossoides (strain CBS 100239) TaxID=1163406 RepID=A0A0L0NLR4_TOLOC|nr:Kinetochore-associated protein NNF1 [Tolypocladium ophioglossoides CBS 100239]